MEKLVSKAWDTGIKRGSVRKKRLEEAHKKAEDKEKVGTPV